MKPSVDFPWTPGCPSYAYLHTVTSQSKGVSCNYWTHIESKGKARKFISFTVTQATEVHFIWQWFNWYGSRAPFM